MIPSLLQIPSAVSDSKLHSVLPNNGKGDFQFERSTGATRINKDGLIEEVGYFSSELVQNGDFSELGAEQILNGGFEGNANNWTLEAGITYGNNNIVFNSVSNQKAIQTQSFVVGKTYKVSIELQEYTSGTITVRMGSVAQVLSTTIGVQTWYIVATGNLARIEGTFGIGVKATLSNVSVKQVDPNDRWTLGTGWSYGNGVATRTSQSGSSLLGANGTTLTVGKTYKCSMTVSNYSNGAVRFATDNVGFTLHSGNGTYTEILTSTGTAFNIKGNADFAGSVSNISVVEVQGDRPRLSYDITNGVVEDKPHLLLEPSATNLATFSEDYTQSVWTKENITVTSNAVISPDGTQNASILTDTSTNGQHRITTSALFSADGNNRVFSIFVKKGTSRYCAINHVAGFTSSVNTVIFDFDTASYVATGTTAYIDEVFTPKHYGNGWYKIAFRSDINSSAYNRLSIGLSNGTSYTDTSYAGTGATVFVWGGQVEQQAYCTSYIPTAGTTITRAAETCNNSKPSVNSTEGVLYCEIAALADDGTFRMLSVSDGTNDNRVRINYSATSEQLQARLVTGGVTQADISKFSAGVLTFHKVAVQFKANEVKLYFDGSLASSDTSASVPSAGTLNVVNFNGGNGANIFYGKVKGLAVYNEALTDAQLIELTS